MATTSLNLLHLPFSKSPPSSFPSRQLPTHLPLKSQINNSNSLVCKGKTPSYNVEVVIPDGEPTDLYLKQFEREVARAGIAQEWRRRKFYESEKEERKRKARDLARSRSRRRRRAGARGRGGKSGGKSGGGDKEPSQYEINDTLAKLLDTEDEEGNVIEREEEELPDDYWDFDGEGRFPVEI